MHLFFWIYILELYKFWAWREPRVPQILLSEKFCTSTQKKFFKIVRLFLLNDKGFSDLDCFCFLFLFFLKKKIQQREVFINLGFLAASCHSSCGNLLSKKSARGHKHGAFRAIFAAAFFTLVPKIHVIIAQNIAGVHKIQYFVYSILRPTILGLAKTLKFRTVSLRVKLHRVF